MNFKGGKKKNLDLNIEKCRQPETFQEGNKFK